VKLTVRIDGGLPHVDTVRLVARLQAEFDRELQLEAGAKPPAGPQRRDALARALVNLGRRHQASAP
jgi:hypothetical protein